MAPGQEGVQAAQDARPDEMTLVEQEVIERVDWFIRLRWLAALGAALTLVAAWYVFGVRFAVRPLAAVIASIFLYNAVFALVVRRMRRPPGATGRATVTLVNVQISLDLVALAFLIYFGGGVENFFIMFFVFHMIIASALLSPTNAYLQATLAALLVNGMCWLDYLRVLPHFGLGGLFLGSGDGALRGLHGDGLYVLMVSSVTTATLYIAVYMASSIATRLREREWELARACRRLQLLDSEKSYFMRRAGHGLRSPLAAIKSLLRLISEGFAGTVDERSRDLIDRTVRRTDDLIALVDDLLRYSRLQATSEIENRQHVSLEALLADTVATFRPMAEEKGIALEVEAGPVTVLGDPEGLADLVSNLLSNAIKYTPAGGQVEVQLRREGDQARLDVRDTGIGIPQEAEEHIFEEFYRAGNAKALEPGGTGLGLAIARRVATVHSGTIRVTSAPGMGSTFSVSLPASERPAAEKPSWPPPESG
jgi:signal transduction histidine kinase